MVIPPRIWLPELRIRNLYITNLIITLPKASIQGLSFFFNGVHHMKEGLVLLE